MIADGQQLERLPVIDVEVSVLTAAQPADRLSRMSPRIHEENAEHVELLVAAGTAVPPIIVHRPTMRVIDGLHRLRAAQRSGRRTIGVRFFDGDEAAAFVLAVTANAGHGLPLSLADRKRAAARIVGCYPRWSDRKIASITGLAPGTVAGIRTDAAGGVDGAGGVDRADRLGRDGRVRPLDAAERRRVAAEFIARNPEGSLREIARAAGISPETARAVKKALRQGEPERPPVPVVQVPAVAPVAPIPAPGTTAGPMIGQASAAKRAVAVRKLKTDPALRFSETGRNLLRMLHLHAVGPQEWNEIIDNVPPHCAPILAELARDCARTWLEFAQRMERETTADELSRGDQPLNRIRTPGPAERRPLTSAAG